MTRIPHHHWVASCPLYIPCTDHPHPKRETTTTILLRKANKCDGKYLSLLVLIVSILWVRINSYANVSQAGRHKLGQQSTSAQHQDDNLLPCVVVVVVVVAAAPYLGSHGGRGWLNLRYEISRIDHSTLPACILYSLGVERPL